MIFGGKRASSLLFLGDLITFTIALWVTLWLRYGSGSLLSAWNHHIGPFLILFALWILVFYMAGLYGKRTILFARNLPNTIFTTHATNIILAVIFFFLFPSVGITPKTTLALYFFISTGLLFFWRLTLYAKLTEHTIRIPAALVASGHEADELVSEVNRNPRYPFDFQYVIKPDEVKNSAELLKELDSRHIQLLVVDTARTHLSPEALALIYHTTRFERRYQFATFEGIYEEVFDRVPLSILEHGWFLENVAAAPSLVYTVAKRCIDVIGALIMGIVTIILIPIIFIANLFESKGPLLIAQERIGERGRRVSAYKFRSMTQHDASSNHFIGEGENKITKVGAFLRRLSLDEFPQFINVLFGEISLIGPRNDIEGLGRRLATAIPYYEARYIVRPGITGWAQINQQYEQNNISPQSVEETKMRLAYDFYYLKHRSLGLDIVIALKTIKRMFFRVST